MRGKSDPVHFGWFRRESWLKPGQVLILQRLSNSFSTQKPRKFAALCRSC